MYDCITYDYSKIYSNSKAIPFYIGPLKMDPKRSSKKVHINIGLFI
jgi:hypothetical protein